MGEKGQRHLYFEPTVLEVDDKVGLWDFLNKFERFAKKIAREFALSFHEGKVEVW